MVADVKQLTEILKSRDKTNTEIMQYIEVSWNILLCGWSRKLASLSDSVEALVALK